MAAKQQHQQHSPAPRQLSPTSLSHTPHVSALLCEPGRSPMSVATGASSTPAAAMSVLRHVPKLPLDRSPMRDQDAVGAHDNGQLVREPGGRRPCGLVVPCTGLRRSRDACLRWRTDSRGYAGGERGACCCAHSLLDVQRTLPAVCPRAAGVAAGRHPCRHAAAAHPPRQPAARP